MLAASLFQHPRAGAPTAAPTLLPRTQRPRPLPRTGPMFRPPRGRRSRRPPTLPDLTSI